MTWTDVLESPYLKDIPFKIELNEWGQVVMSPASNKHSNFEGKIFELLLQQKTDGAALLECSIQTSKNVKVPDAVWMSSKFIKAHNLNEELETPLLRAPEVCVEVISPSNSREELAGKRQLYFECEAVEVWFCSSEGAMSFFDRSGEIPQSRLFPNFPSTIKKTLI